jgi:glutamine amidotransferase
MQILATEGQEFGNCSGLGWLPGVVRLISFSADHEGARKLPHIGWTPVDLGDCSLFEDLPRTCYFYFVHSYVLSQTNPCHVVATAAYGETFPAAVMHQNIFACQFHPEKSDQPGLRLLENFCRWTPRVP